MTTTAVTSKQKTATAPEEQKNKGYVSANRTFKATIFAMVFSDKKELLELYNAVSGKDYTDPELLEINTLENAVYMSMRNDLSFIIDFRLSLYEHQSTYNPNIPLRNLFYISDLYSGITREENLYGTKVVRIPNPQFIVFYNGEKEMPDRTVLNLSDMYYKQEGNVPEQFDLELKVIMLNVNSGHNKELMDSCKTLREYAEYTARVRNYAREMSLESAVERAITECIAEGILADFLRKNKAEAKKMSIYEYDQEKHIRQEREAAREDGLEEGRKEGRKEGREEGREEGKKLAVEMLCELGVAKETAVLQLIERYGMEQEEAAGFVARYWKE